MSDRATYDHLQARCGVLCVWEMKPQYAVNRHPHWSTEDFDQRDDEPSTFYEIRTQHPDLGGIVVLFSSHSESETYAEYDRLRSERDWRYPECLTA